MADPDRNEYELEVGERLNASTAMIALCSHIDEIMEALKGSKLGIIVLQSIHTEEIRLAKLLHQDEVAIVPKQKQPPR